MHAIKFNAGILLALSLIGCASSPVWRHAQFVDQASAQRQFVIDNGYCKMVSAGSVPAPTMIPVERGGSQFINMTGNSFNTRTGAATHSNYSGQVTSGGGFASGMANGMNLGAAIAADRDRKLIHQSCMYSKGWTDNAAE